MNKAIIREHAKKRLRSIPSSDVNAYQDNLYRQLFQSKEWKEAQTIGVTVSMDLEVNTQPIMQEAIRTYKRIAIPRVVGKELYFHLYNEDELEQHSFGMNEPKATAPLVHPDEIDLLLVPGLAYTMDGDRIGYGGGFYDRYLAQFSGETMSLLYPEQIIEEGSFFIEPHDQPVQQLLIANDSRILMEKR